MNVIEKPLPVAYHIVRNDADVSKIAKIFLRCADAERKFLFGHQKPKPLSGRVGFHRGKEVFCQARFADGLGNVQPVVWEFGCTSNELEMVNKKAISLACFAR